MLFEILFAASSLVTANYDELRTQALAEEDSFSREQRSSWYPFKLGLFNKAVPTCLLSSRRQRSVQFNAVAILEGGQIKDVVLSQESRESKCVARQLRGMKMPPLEKVPEHILFEMTFNPA